MPRQGYKNKKKHRKQMQEVPKRVEYCEELDEALLKSLIAHRRKTHPLQKPTYNMKSYSILHIKSKEH